MALISGSDISPTFLASKSPKVRAMAIPGPSSSAQILKGPTGLSYYIIYSILPPILSILAFSSGLVGFQSQLSSIANLSFFVFLNITALLSPKLAIYIIFFLMKTVIAHVPELLQSIPEDFNLSSADLNASLRNLVTELKLVKESIFFIFCSK